MTNTLTGTYDLDTTHSTVGFTVRHAMVTKVRGNFNDFEATLTVNQENPAESKVCLLYTSDAADDIALV